MDCGECAAGFYGDKGAFSCDLPCECEVQGSTNSSCHISTGQCRYYINVWDPQLINDQIQECHIFPGLVEILSRPRLDRLRVLAKVASSEEPWLVPFDAAFSPGGSPDGDDWGETTGF